MGREHIPRLKNADEIVVSIKVQVAVDLNEPGSTAGAAGHATGDGDHIPASMLPGGADQTLAGLSGLAIERRGGGIAIGVEGLIGRLIICPTSATNHIG